MTPITISTDVGILLVVAEGEGEEVVEEDLMMVIKQYNFKYKK